MLFKKYRIKRKCFRYFDHIANELSRAEMFLESWASLGATANDEWGTYIPAKDTYRYAEDWHYDQGRSVAAFHEVNRLNQIKVNDELNKFFLQIYEEDKDPINLEFANDSLISKKGLEDCPSNNISVYMQEYLGG